MDAKQKTQKVVDRFSNYFQEFMIEAAILLIGELTQILLASKPILLDGKSRGNNIFIV